MLKNLLKEGQAWVILLNETNRKQFLKEAREEGFKWMGGADIQKKDECFFHVLIKDQYISNISSMCYIKCKKLNKYVQRYIDNSCNKKR